MRDREGVFPAVCRLPMRQGGIWLAGSPRLQGEQGARETREGIGEEGKLNEGSRGSVLSRVPPPDTTGGIGLASLPRFQVGSAPGILGRI
jgi:hypothetical protein